jgi:hypothetical protein
VAPNDGVGIRGGDKLEKVLRGMAARVQKANTVQVGFLESAQSYAGGLPTAAVAAIQEYGAPKVGIPPRPFFRTMISKESPGWPDMIADLLKVHDYDANKVLSNMGEEMVGQLKQSINELTDPPLSPVTLMLRKMVGPNGVVTSYKQVVEARARVAAGESYGGVSTKPLIWSSHLINSVAFRVA